MRLEALADCRRFLGLASPSSDTQKLTRAKRIRQAVSLASLVCPLALPDSPNSSKQFPPSRPFVTICSSTTREGCANKDSCRNVHFVQALRSHTDTSLGDCSYLNTCHRMETCRYVHWVLEDPGKMSEEDKVRRKEEEAERAKDRESSEKVGN